MSSTRTFGPDGLTLTAQQIPITSLNVLPIAKQKKVYFRCLLRLGFDVLGSCSLFSRAALLLILG